MPENNFVPDNTVDGPVWDQPPTHGWAGVGQPDIGIQHEMEGWAGAGNANIAMDQEEGQFGAHQNIAN